MPQLFNDAEAAVRQRIVNAAELFERAEIDVFGFAGRIAAESNYEPEQVVAVIDRWLTLSGTPAVAGVEISPVPAPRGVPDTRDTQTTQWFRDCWGEAQQRAPEIVVEVHNNSPRTPPQAQLELERAAIILTIEQLLEAA